eukprot:364956-Chlamydomonas_euryale.AAC.3
MRAHASGDLCMYTVARAAGALRMYMCVRTCSRGVARAGMCGTRTFSQGPTRTRRAGHVHAHVLAHALAPGIPHVLAHALAPGIPHVLAHALAPGIPHVHCVLLPRWLFQRQLPLNANSLPPNHNSL